MNSSDDLEVYVLYMKSSVDFQEEFDSVIEECDIVYNGSKVYKLIRIMVFVFIVSSSLLLQNFIEVGGWPDWWKGRSV